MKNQAHIVYSEAPLPENVNHLAVCGAIIHRAKLCFLWDEQTMGEPLDLRPNGLCKDCYLSHPPEGTFMVYGFKRGDNEA